MSSARSRSEVTLDLRCRLSIGAASNGTNIRLWSFTRTNGHKRCGTLEVGKAADFTLWDIKRPAELVYRIGFNPLHARVVRGQLDPL